MTDPILKKATELTKHTKPCYQPITGRIAYVVSHGQSYASNGYAIRTHGIAKALNGHGLETLCFVRPGRPWDMGIAKDTVTPEMQIDGVRYIHSRWPGDKKPGTEEQKFTVTINRLVELFTIYRPQVVIAASNHEIALPALVAARQLGLPFQYEVRGFWEVSRASRDPAWEDSAEYQEHYNRECWVISRADQLYTLNTQMKDELVARGAKPEQIDLVPNSVSGMPRIVKQSNVRQQYGIPNDAYVLGYMGAITEYEGLDHLLEALKLLKKEKVYALIVGGYSPVNRLGRAKPEPIVQKLQKLAKSYGIHKQVIFTGRVDHDKLPEYFAAADATVIPRAPLPVCELVSAIKPLEYLSYGKPLIASNVAPQAEVLEQGKLGWLYEKGDSQALADAVRALNKHTPEEIAAKTQQGIRAVNERYQWHHTTKPMITSVTVYGGKKKPKPQEKEDTSDEASKPLLSVEGAVELHAKDPIWHSVDVTPGASLDIGGKVSYRNTGAQKNRKSVLLIKSFDRAGKELQAPCGKMAKSGHLKAYFKYLPDSGGKKANLHSFNVPVGVTQLKIGFVGFNTTEDEKVVLEQLTVHDIASANRFEAPSQQAAEISILGWPEYPPNGKPYVMGIMDEFTTGCFEQDLNLIQPRPDNWYALAEKYKPEFIFIESAWKGNFGSWQYRVANYANKPGKEVEHLCQYAREKGIPTLFWNKEDPVHHDKFMCSAERVDHIFTTDANMKNSYHAKTGNPNVHALPFAAQPALHKPAPLEGRKPLSCFAGSWYGNRHAERGEAMGWLLQAANKHGLDIYDRNYGTGIFPFPDEYQAGIKGSLPYKELCEEYSRYRVFLNVNSVTDSPTMFSRRVFELMACGTPVVSTYAKGIDNLFESDAVWMVHSQEEANEAIHTLMTDDIEWRRRSLAGIREVFAKHTYAHRLNDIFDQLGIESRMPTEPKVLLLAQAHSQAELAVLDQFARHQRYSHFRLGIECSPGITNQAGLLSDRIELLQFSERRAWIQRQHDEHVIVGWLTPQSQYGEHYLRDLANASLYEPEASGWAKSINHDRFTYGEAAALAGTLWNMNEFSTTHLTVDISANPEMKVQGAGVFVTDSDQFQLSGAAHRQVV